MALPPAFLDELRARVSLVDLIGRRVKLQKKGREWVGLSPFQNEKTPSFTVVPEKGFFHCFSSGEHGDAIGWVMRMEGLTFPEAVEKLAGEVGLEVPRPSPRAREEEARRATLSDALELACTWYEAQLRGPEGAAARAYLEGRGLDAEAWARFRLGYAPKERGGLLRHLKAHKVDPALAAEAGLVKLGEDGGAPRDYFFDRVLFPIADRKGRVVGFGGRTLQPDGKPKYLNTPETPLFRKGQSLYNLDRARKAAHEAGEVVVAEGYMDVIALDRAGFAAAVAPLGTAVTEEQIAELWRLAPEPVICLDGDQAGQKAGMRVAERALPGLLPGRSLRFASLPAGEDPDSLLATHGPHALRRALDAARPLSDLVWLQLTGGRDLSTPERRAGLRQDIFRITEAIRDEGVRRAYRDEMLARFDAAYGFGARRARGAKDWKARGQGAGRPPRRERAGGPRGGGGWREQPLASPFPRPHPDLLRRRPEQALLACAVNHPELPAEDCETFAALPLSAPPFDRLRRAIADAVAESPELDSDTLKGILERMGFARELTAIQGPAVTLHAPFARPETPLAEARDGWRALAERLATAQPDTETAEAARQFAHEMGEETLARLRTRQRVAVHAHPGSPGALPAAPRRTPRGAGADRPEDGRGEESAHSEGSGMRSGVEPTDTGE